MASENPCRFDRATAIQLVTDEVNERWRGMVSIEGGGPPTSTPSDLSPLDAAIQLRYGLEQGVSPIREAYGLVGENLPSDQFTMLADKVWEKKASAWDDGRPPERIWPPTADPREGMYYALMKSWDAHFFDTQRGNAARMIRGLMEAIRTNPIEAAPPAYDLLRRLKQATIVPGLDDLWNLLGDVIEFLQVFTVTQADHEQDEPSWPLAGPKPLTEQRGFDDSPYRPASELWPDKFESYGKFGRWLRKHPEIRTQHPRANRLEIHAGDWVAYWAKSDSASFESLDKGEYKSISEADTTAFLEGAAERLAVVREEKEIRKRE